MAVLMMLALARGGLYPGPDLTMGRCAQRVRMLAAPSRKIEDFQTVSVSCAKCNTRLFGYKKKNGLKSALVKCYIERIVEDPFGLLSGDERAAELGSEWACPSCSSVFARSAVIRGRPALKLAGGKARMHK